MSAGSIAEGETHVLIWDGSTWTCPCGVFESTEDWRARGHYYAAIGVVMNREELESPNPDQAFYRRMSTGLIHSEDRALD